MKKLRLSLVAIVLLLAACSSKEEAHDGHAHSNGDIQEETASAEILPSFLDEQPENIRLTYQIAGQATELLEWIPCYCGCGESAGHRNNLNCFIQEVKEDGAVVWDDHGTRCIACLEIALQSAKMYKDGMELKEIRETIDEMYKKGYAKPTDTPFPA
ncbi:PCYCGC motif-containing (lipo)protein [Metasolibacillus meyeri]|uniref:PCYCGC motif-containing (Lipo)protein n=1 Tax=Metasolibacillus meyeri TaxID=1071052 RepID=A0AAW9NSU8_9BACL|nr:PCYCGC motif-containing (lipo)protein [Metasolibacillus meyeri]MEC1180782.1 PCYCGC motif-containing (lipo)protein [Metasolibacillus meyeri]